MAFKKPQKILSSARLSQTLLSTNRGTLNRLLAHSQDLLALQMLVRKMVPGDIFVASMDKGQLHLITPSAALATRLKYSQASLLASLKQRHNPYPVDSIKISVRPDYIPATRTARTPAQPSAKSAEQVAETAKYIEDADLRKALFNLSRHIRPANE
jgi:hypothetical protein